MTTWLIFEISAGGIMGRPFPVWNQVDKVPVSGRSWWVSWVADLYPLRFDCFSRHILSTFFDSVSSFFWMNRSC